MPGPGLPDPRHPGRALPHGRLVRAATGLDAATREAFVRLCEDPSAPLRAGTWGREVVAHRTSRVRRGALVPGGEEFHVKGYDLATVRERLRAFPRSLVSRTRAVREFDALEWLADQGVQPRLAVAAWVRRARPDGLVAEAVLATRTWGQGDLASVLGRAPAPQRLEELAAALRAFCTRLDRAGFVDPNLDPRNLLLHRAPDGAPEFAKIDSPRWRRRAGGPARPVPVRLTEGLARCGCSPDLLHRHGLLQDGLDGSPPAAD